MIDLTTLAAAKAYTDKKTAGGASGGGLPVVELGDITAILGTSRELTEEEKVQFESAIANNNYAMVIFDLMGMPLFAHCRYSADTTIMQGFVFVPSDDLTSVTPYLVNIGIENGSRYVALLGGTT